jgi:hypothetical protein
MKDSIQENSHEVSIVIYDSPLPPRYLKFSKKFIRTLFVVAPITLGLVFITLLILILAPKVKDTQAPNLSAVLNTEDSKTVELETEVKMLKESNILLQEKISGQLKPESNQEEAFLLAIKKPYGMQNLTAEKRVALEQFEFISSQDKANLKFQIISTNPENRVAGHIIVFMISKGGMMAYPEEANTSIYNGIKFSMGEPFAVSRLRPTNAEFSAKPIGEDVRFIIYIFTREGDLLLTRETESYKVGDK